MKRKVLAVSAVLAALLTAYTAYAYLATRGLRVYLIGTRLGGILASSWQITLLAALLLWIPGAAVLIRKVSGRRGDATKAAKQTETVDQGAEKRLESRAAAVTAETELLKPRAAAAAAETELPEPQAAAAPPTPAPAKAGPTPPQKPPAFWRRRAAARYCPNCGHEVTGKRFCPECGTKIEEG